MKDFFKGKKIVIFGLGLYENGSGVSSALFFAKQKANVLVTDLRSKDELKKQINRLKRYKNIRYSLGGHKEGDFKNCDLVIKNPAIPKNSKFLKIAKKNKIPVYNDWSVFLSISDNFIIGVTGTRGKSTTTTLINEFLKSKYKTHLCGNIGVSPLSILNKIKKQDIIVAELSSWLLNGFKEVKRSPNVSVITNLMPDHLDKYSSLKEYYNDKKNIFKYQKEDDILILNKENKDVRLLKKEAKSKVFWFSKKPLGKKESGVFLQEENVFFKVDDKISKVVSLKRAKIKGEHNKENFLASILVALIFNISKKDILNVVKNFDGVKDRMEFLSERGGVKFYNDTTATSPDASVASFKALGCGKNLIIIAGGKDKGLAYDKFAFYAKKYGKKIILFSGDASDKIKKELLKVGFSEKNIKDEVNSMKYAVNLACGFAEKGDIVLLSPGSASFGLFKNEFDRGDKFKNIIKKIK